ncbi:lipoprotein insertase outer membrane protein LolB [Methyloprofundus sp.]|uniref:lipoprotein insertase outer membrane protein LolB n=1 Tax=Methyloprofundus sp. TaxID=2020875 RepID=UPI003D13272B
MRVSALCCICVLLLMGCSSVKTHNAKHGQQLSQQQRLDIKQWKMQGRLLIKSDDVLTANVHWQHNQQEDILKLSGALGFGAMLIELSEDEIVLHNAQGERQSARDIDAFIARQIGFIVPITALRQWVIGAYLQGVPVEQMANGFEQLGWLVAYNEYMDTPAGVMPRSIKVTKGNIQLKLIVDQWEIE